MHAETIITVRYTGGTWVARAKGFKKTASCVYDPALAAKALAGKMGLDVGSLERVATHADGAEFKALPLRRLPAQWKMAPLVPSAAMSAAGDRALAAGGTVDQVFAAMLEQTPCPEAQPPQGARGVRVEMVKSDLLAELDSAIKDLSRQEAGEYRARYLGEALGFLRALSLLDAVDLADMYRWKARIVETHLQAIAQCEAAGEVVPEDIKRREAFRLEILRTAQRSAGSMQSGGEA